MKKLSAEELLAYHNKFISYIDNYISEPRASKLKKLYSDIEEILITSPAASMKANHSAYPGGYLVHVLKVIESAIVVDRVWEKFGYKRDYTIEELVFSAINHDLGKLGDGKNPFYIPNDSQWHIEKQGAYYKYNPEVTSFRIPDRSLFTLQKYGIEYSENEFLAIKLHDGLYEESNKTYLSIYAPEMRLKTKIHVILHQADTMAAHIEGIEDKNT